MVVGVGLNYWVIDQISVVAHDAYRERLLIGRSGGKLTGTVDGTTSSAQDDDVINMIELLREEGALSPPDPRENPAVGKRPDRQIPQ